MIYDDDNFSQGYDQIKEAFRVLRKDDILKPYISDHDFRSLNVRVENIGYSSYVFDMGYQQKFPSFPNNQSRV